jgi:hypothetical protein
MDTFKENKTSTVTVEFPISQELLDLDVQQMLEIIRLHISESFTIDPEKVWVKSISHTTEVETDRILGLS